MRNIIIDNKDKGNIKRLKIILFFNSLKNKNN